MVANVICPPYILSIGGLLILPSCSHADRDPQILTPSPGTIALGLCTGSLAAIAIAAVNNVMDLLRIAPDVVRLAFKVGLAAEKRASSLENAKGCWAAAVSGLSYEGIESVLDVCYTKVGR